MNHSIQRARRERTKSISRRFLPNQWSVAIDQQLMVPHCPLVASPAFIVAQAADRLQHPTTRVNQLWQTDFTHLKVIGYGASRITR